MNNYETKTTKFELKELSEEGIIVGYGSVFEVTDDGNDIVKKGAFNRTLNSGKKVKMLWQHDRSQPIGVWTEMAADEHGLLMSGQLAMETQKGRETYSLLKMGAIDGLSIGYQVVQSEFNNKGERELKELNLREVSIVSFPMLEEATVMAVKSDLPELNIAQMKEVSDFIRSLIEKVESPEKFDDLQDIAGDITSILKASNNNNIASTINSIISNKN